MVFYIRRSLDFQRLPESACVRNTYDYLYFSPNIEKPPLKTIVGSRDSLFSIHLC